MDRKELISIRLDLLRKEIREYENVEIVGVSKTYPPEDIQSAYEAGLHHLGENRVEELERKAQVLETTCPDLKWHFIGKLQRNKVKRLLAIDALVAIHSIDSKELLEEIYKHEGLIKKEIHFYLQVNTSEEKEKSGFSNYDELAAIINLIANQSSSKFLLKGLMTMSKIRTNDFQADARACFKKLVSYKKQLSKDFDLENLSLSMGMSSDYLIGCQEGSSCIRVGSYFFKPELS